MIDRQARGNPQPVAKNEITRGFQRPDWRISLLELIELFEGRLELVEEREEPPAAEIWHHLSTVLRNETNSISVADLARLLTEQNPPAPNFTI